MGDAAVGRFVEDGASGAKGRGASEETGEGTFDDIDMALQYVLDGIYFIKCMKTERPAMYSD